MAPKPTLRVDVPDMEAAASEVPESDIIAMAGPGAVEVEEVTTSPLSPPAKRSVFTPRGLLERTATLLGRGPKTEKSPSGEKRVNVNPLSMAAGAASFATVQQLGEAAGQVRSQSAVSGYEGRGCAAQERTSRAGGLMGAA